MVLTNRKRSIRPGREWSQRTRRHKGSADHPLRCLHAVGSESGLGGHKPSSKLPRVARAGGSFETEAGHGESAARTVQRNGVPGTRVHASIGVGRSEHDLGGNWVSVVLQFVLAEVGEK